MRARYPRDNAKLKIAAYLSGRAEGATRNEVSQKSDIRKRGDGELKAILEEMIQAGWVTSRRTSVGGGMTVYALADDGRAALEHARGLRAQGHPLSSLDVFGGL